MESALPSLLFLLPVTSGEKQVCCHLQRRASKNKPRRVTSSFATLTCLCLDHCLTG